VIMYSIWVIQPATHSPLCDIPKYLLLQETGGLISQNPCAYQAAIATASFPAEIRIGLVGSVTARQLVLAIRGMHQGPTRHWTVVELAERVGYGSASAFSVAFTRHVGLPPARYAKAQPGAGLLSAS
jgi:AraC-like DNA-binding protein